MKVRLHLCQHMRGEHTDGGGIQGICVGAIQLLGKIPFVPLCLLELINFDNLK